MFVAVAGLVLAACAGRRGRDGNPAVTAAQAAVRTGETIYREDCARCHGPRGEGVAGKHDETLHGEQSVESLARAWGE